MENSALPPPIGFGYRISIHLQADPLIPVDGTVAYIDPSQETAVLWIPSQQQYWSFQYQPTNNQLVDPAIQKYSVAEYPAELGFARQNKLVPGQWIEIQLQQDTILYTGVIRDIEEDMITVDIQTPERLTVYFDFEYRGLVHELGIQLLRRIPGPAAPPPGPGPGLTPIAEEYEPEPAAYNDDGEPVSSMPSTSPNILATSNANGLRDSSNSRDSNNSSDMDVEELEEDVDVLVQTEIRDSQKQYDLKRQLTEMINKLYSDYGTNALSPLLHAQITDIVERFVISHDTFTQYDDMGNAVGFHRHFEGYRPFYQEFSDLTDLHKCPYIMPVSAAIPILYQNMSSSWKKGKRTDDDEEEEDDADEDDDGEEDGEAMNQNPDLRIRKQIKQIREEYDITKTSTTLSERHRRLLVARQPFAHDKNIVCENTTPRPIFALVRNPKENVVEEEGLGNERKDEQTEEEALIEYAVPRFYKQQQLVPDPTFLQSYLPGETIHIHSIYKLPKRPTHWSSLKSSHFTPTTPVVFKTHLSQMSDYHKLWRAPHSLRTPLDPDRLFALRGNPEIDQRMQMPEDAFPHLPLFISELAHAFRSCTSYCGMIRILEQYATMPRHVDRHAAGQLIQYTENNVRSFREQYKQSFEFIRELTTVWVKREQEKEKEKEEKETEEKGETDGDVDGREKEKGPRFTSTEWQSQAMETDGGQLRALQIQLRNAKLYNEERLLHTAVDKPLRILAKQYASKEDMLADRESPVFDPALDTTPYSLLEKYKKERATMAPGHFREWLEETLVQVHGVPLPMAKDMTVWILQGARPVRQGEYAQVGASTYYRWSGQARIWEKDDSVTADSFLALPDLYSQKTRLENAAGTEYLKVGVAEKEAERTVQEIQTRVEQVHRDTTQTLQQKIKDQLHRQEAHRINLEIRDHAYLRKQQAIGQQPATDMPDMAPSPFLSILNKIRSKGTHERGVLIHAFYKTYCTDSSTLYLPTDPLTKYWKYCKATGGPLLPTSEYEMAKQQMMTDPAKKELVYKHILSEYGIEMDGDIYDKYTGHLLQQGILEYQEQFTEEGHLNRAHEVIRDDARAENEWIENQIQKGALIEATDNLIEEEVSAVTMRKEITMYQMSEITSYAHTLLMRLHLNPAFIQATITRLANQFRNKHTTKAVYTKHAKAGAPTFEAYLTSVHVFIAINVVLIAIHTSVPPVQSSPLIATPAFDHLRKISDINADPGEDWKNAYEKGLQTIVSFVENLAKNNVAPWNVFNAQSLTRKKWVAYCYKYFKDVMQKEPLIASLYSARLEYTQTIIQSKRRDTASYDWPGFLPYLKPCPNLAPNPKFPENMGRGAERERIQAMANSYYNAMAIFDQINQHVQTEPMVMTTMANVPFIENGCCNSVNESIFPYDYFLSNLGLDIGIESRAAMTAILQKEYSHMTPYFRKSCPVGARDLAMAMSHNKEMMTEEQMGSAIIYYLNLNETRGYVGIPTAYANILAEIPAGWNKSAPVKTQYRDFLAATESGRSIQELFYQIWTTETKTAIRMADSSMTPFHAITQWTVEQGGKEHGGTGEVHRWIQQWLETADFSKYQEHTFKGIEGDEFHDFITSMIRVRQRELLPLLSSENKQVLTQLEGHINELYHHPKRAHEIIGFLQNMIYMDAREGLVTLSRSEVLTKRVKSSKEQWMVYMDNSFFYNKLRQNFVGPSLRKLYRIIMEKDLFRPWLALVGAMMTPTPLLDGVRVKDKEEDPYLYLGLPPFIVARLYYFIWMQIWFLWTSEAAAIPDTAAELLMGEEGGDEYEEEEEFTRATVMKHGQVMLNLHVSYHGRGMMDILMSEEMIYLKTHQTKQSEKQQIDQQCKKMDKSGRIMKKMLITFGLETYDIEETRLDAHYAIGMGDREGGGEGGDGGEEGEGEGAEMLNDGNNDEQEDN